MGRARLESNPGKVRRRVVGIARPGVEEASVPGLVASDRHGEGRTERGLAQSAVVHRERQFAFAVDGSPILCC